MPRPKKNKSVVVETPSRQLLAESRKALLEDSDSENDFQTAEASPTEAGFKVNEAYARRFEHNKKREELHRLEEKYGPAKPELGADDDYSDESSSSSEDEDDNAILATKEVDAQISNILNAIRSKDPRVYDGKTTFFDPVEEAAAAAAAETEKAEKPMYLRDYHRENLLAGHTGAESDDEDTPQTFVQQQAELKRSVVRSMHAAAEADADSDDEEAFMVRKSKPEEDSDSPAELPDPATADPNNPDEYLQKFLNSRVWTKGNGHAPLESDDSESDADAEQLEHAYNLRFENPDALERAKLVSYGRDAVKDNTVRRAEKSRRKKAREEKRTRKEEEKIQREIEKKRLTKLKTDELMEKLKKIKEAAGLDLVDEEAEADVFHKLLEGDFSDGEWEGWMQNRFGEQYYTGDDALKKPDFDDDIDIKDIIPDFSDDEDEDAEDVDPEAESNVPEIVQQKFQKHLSKREQIQAARDAKAKQNSTRRKLARFVEENVDFDSQLPGGTKGTFRYRESTPETYGLTPIDILAAGDADLNSYAGLKKYASFRDAEKKERDRKKYGKKKRLKQWRKETFGDVNGVEMPKDWKPEGLVHKRGTEEGEAEAGVVDVVGEEGPRKKRRKKSKKA